VTHALTARRDEHEGFDDGGDLLLLAAWQA